MSDEPSELTHLDARGHARMVDVTEKSLTDRRAVAEGHIRMSDEAYAALEAGDNKKGDALQVARIAAIMGGKKTADWIPLCHPLPGLSLSVDVELAPDLPGVRLRAEARVAGPTGVEMEAITAVSVGLVTVYDMVKALDRRMEIGGVRLLAKSGGRSGDWTAEN